LRNVFIQESNLVSPLGFNLDENWNSLLANQTGISKINSLGNFKDFYAARIDDVQLDLMLNKDFVGLETSRIEKLLTLVLLPLIKDRINEQTILILSTTKGNVNALQNNLNEAFLSILANQIKNKFKFFTQPIIVSNACTSGILAVNVAKRLLQMNKAENAFVIAVDELTEFVVSGFNAFQAMSNEICKPYDLHRKGVNLGEAAAVMYLTNFTEENGLNYKILGEGNINDANHISGPSRTGEGLFLSINSAFKEAKISAKEIDYISAHGTATIYNDEMEAIAFNRLGLEDVETNSLKAFYGHTLGASGLLELALACKQMQENTLIKSLGFEENGVSESLNILTQNQVKEVNIILKTASGFGGTNAAIIVSKNG